MTVKTFARVQDGLVAETLTTAADITSLFHPTLVWLDASASKNIAPGWSYSGGTFAPPSAEPPAPPQPTIAELQVQLTAISQRLAALSAGS